MGQGEETVNIRVKGQGQWHNNCPCRPCIAGGPRGSGGPCANPPNFFSRHSCGLCIVVLMGAAQFTLNCSIAGKGPYDHVLQPLQGGGEFVVTPLVKVTGVRKMTNLWRQYLQNWWVSFSANWHKCGQQGKGMKCSTLAVWSSKPHDAVIRFGDLAEASFLTPLCWICFLVLICVFMVFTCLDVMYFRI